jgi:tetratricopeptide (TPR) repeat protein
VLFVAKRKVKGIALASANHTYRRTSGSTTFFANKLCFHITASSPEEKERFLSSVIKSLRSDTALAGSLAGIHALVLRASARCEAENYPAALQDAQEALAALQSQQRQVHVSWEGQAWRVSADAHQALGNFPAAVEALQEWAVHTPSFRTKAMKEIQRLQSI